MNRENNAIIGKIETSPRVVITINNKQVLALVDTGAVKSLINGNTIDKLNINNIRQCETKLYDVNKNQLKTKGQTILKLQIENEVYEQNFIIADEISDECILGSDAIINLGIIIDGKRQKIYVEQNNTEFRIAGINNDDALENQLQVIRQSIYNQPKVHKIKKLKKEELSVSKQVEVDLPEEIAKELQKKSKENKWSVEEKEKLRTIMKQYIEVFAKTKMDVGHTTVVKHKIDTQGHEPIKQRPYRIPHHLREIANKEVKDMLDKNIIKPSNSPWAAPVVLIQKKNGEPRFCIDFRKLNEITKKDAYPIPNLDMASGYWQIELEETDKEKSAFIIDNDIFEFNRLPFGMCNAPATFQRFMNQALKGLIGQICMVYLDDIIILGKTIDSHTNNIKMIIRCRNKIKIPEMSIFPKRSKLFRSYSNSKRH